jgi:thiamine-monophosphate kinase
MLSSEYPGDNLETLRELGELGVIRILERKLGTNPRTAVGFGDDISAVKMDDGRKVLVLKTDMLVGSTDVPPGMTVRQAARKAVVANVSDMAAKGVRPLAGLVALGLPEHLTAHDVNAVANGLKEAAREYRFPLVGGDTNESKDLTITIALFGIAKNNQLVLRSGARVGDLIAVTGEFGSSTAGLKALIEKKKRPNQLPRQLFDAVYYPQAQLELGLKLANSGALTSSIDSSDGLAWSLHELAKSSRVGVRIDNVPISKIALKFAAEFGYDANELAFYGGEEYHIVATVKPDKVKSIEQTAHGKLRIIGAVTPRTSGVLFRYEGKDLRVEQKGWEHFKQKNYR